MEATLWHCMAHYGIGRWAVEGRLWQWVIAIGRESQGSAGIISPVWEVPGVTLVRSRPEIVLAINVRQYLYICCLKLTGKGGKFQIFALVRCIAQKSKNVSLQIYLAN